MATRFSRSQSPRQILFHFRHAVSGEALNALEERDADWRRENDALRAENYDILHRSRWMEEELTKQTRLRRDMEEELERVEDKEKWLEGRVRCLEAEVRDSERANREELDRVSKEKAVLEAKLHKQQRLIRTNDVIKKESGDFEYVPGHLKLEKNERASKSKVKLEGQGRMSIGSDASQRVQDFERKNKELQGEVCNVKRENDDGIRRISIEKMAEEAEREKAKNEELSRRVQALETDNADLQDQMRQSNNWMITEMKRMLDDKMALENQYMRTEEEKSEKIFQLANKCELLEMEKGGIEADFCHALHEKVVLGGKVSELLNRIEFLETEKGGETEAKLCKPNQENKSEIERIMKENMAFQVALREADGQIRALDIGKKQSKQSNKEKQHIINKLLKEKKDLEAKIRIVVEESKERISHLVKRVEVLVTEKDSLVHQKSRTEEAEKLVAEFRKTIDDLKIENGALEAKFREMSEKMGRTVKEKVDSDAEKSIIICELNKTIDALKTMVKEKVDSDAEKSIIISELNMTHDALKTKMTDLYAELCQIKEEKSEEMRIILKKKKLMEDENKAKFLDLTKRFEVLRREKRETEAKFCRIKEKSEEMEMILTKKKIMEDENMAKLSELTKRAEVLRRDKREIEAKFSQIKEKSEKMEMILKKKNIMEDENKAKFSDMTKMVEVLRREKREEMEMILKKKKIMDDENKSKFSEMTNMVEVLRRDKRKLEADFSQIKEEKKIMEDENNTKFLELTNRVEVLRRENREMEADFCQANKDKCEEMKRLLSENIAMQAEKSASEEKASKKSLELANRIGILEREKQGLEAEITDKDEVIKVVAKENNCLENRIKKLNIELANSLPSKFNKEEVQVQLSQPSKFNKEEVQVQLSQPLHHPGNVGMLTTNSWRAKGKKPVGGCKRKRTNVSKSKHKRHFSEGASENRELVVWETDEDLLAAFDRDPELCLKAVCTLYRHHLLIADPITTSGGSEPSYSSKAGLLAEYLVDEDPEGRLRKTVADVECLDPLAVRECRDIAKQHYKQLFELYNNKQDPFFLS